VRIVKHSSDDNCEIRAVVTFSTQLSLNYAVNYLDGEPLWLSDLVSNADEHRQSGHVGQSLRVVLLPIGEDPVTYQIPPLTAPCPVLIDASIERSHDFLRRQAWSPHVVVGGVGGSGTRLVAVLHEAPGFFMGFDQVSNFVYDCGVDGKSYKAHQKGLKSAFYSNNPNKGRIKLNSLGI
jgi:hypothetical protein